MKQRRCIYNSFITLPYDFETSGFHSKSLSRTPCELLRCGPLPAVTWGRNFLHSQTEAPVWDSPTRHLSAGLFPCTPGSTTGFFHAQRTGCSPSPTSACTSLHRGYLPCSVILTQYPSDPDERRARPRLHWVFCAQLHFDLLKANYIFSRCQSFQGNMNKVQSLLSR